MVQAADRCQNVHQELLPKRDFDEAGEFQKGVSGFPLF